MFKSVKQLVAEAEARQVPVSEVVMEKQSAALEVSREVLLETMKNRFKVMQEAIQTGLTQDLKSVSGLVGGDGRKVEEARQKGSLAAGGNLAKAIARALAVAEVNASMGCIVAAPTAGSCGILPAVITTVAEEYGAGEDVVVKALFTAAGLGLVIAGNASVSGAAGGCQAECGAASAMAAAAAVEIAGGRPGQSAQAAAIALKNVLGLVCDPVAGLVEVPCVKRNAMAAANALVAVDLALAGVESIIPVDEVINAMAEVGRALPSSLKETAQGGLANTPTAREIEKRIFTGNL